MGIQLSIGTQNGVLCPADRSARGGLSIYARNETLYPKYRKVPSGTCDSPNQESSITTLRFDGDMSCPP